MIEQIDKKMTDKAQQNRQLKQQLAEERRYTAFHELPADWSLKTWVDISVADADDLRINTDELSRYLQYFVFSSDSSKGLSDTIVLGKPGS